MQTHIKEDIMKVFIFWLVTFLLAADSSAFFQTVWPIGVWILAIVIVYIGPQIPHIFDIFD